MTGNNIGAEAGRALGALATFTPVAPEVEGVGDTGVADEEEEGETEGVPVEDKARASVEGAEEDDAVLESAQQESCKGASACCTAAPSTHAHPAPWPVRYPGPTNCFQKAYQLRSARL